MTSYFEQDSTDLGERVSPLGGKVMRYICILMMLMSFSAQAEWRSNGNNIYSKDIEFNSLTERVSVQLLTDDSYPHSSLVYHMQYQCENGVPTKQRELWAGFYDGRMGTGEVIFESRGAPWMPFEDNRYTVIVITLCAEMDRKRPQRNQLY